MDSSDTIRGLSLTEVSKAYGRVQAVEKLSFNIRPGDITALLGPSGCGKSTTLAIIAGLVRPDHGEITWQGKSILQVPSHQRGFGLMFQDYALFPHMAVDANIAFGLKMQKLPPKQIRQRVSQLLRLVGLPGYEKRDVNTLSGGEQQRVALARALAPSPRLLMLDEPLGSLDRGLRESLLSEMDDILRRSGQTTLYVTHDQEEAFALADQIVLMNAGHIEQIASPQELYQQPASIFAARFIGLNNLFPGEVRAQSEGRSVVETALGTFAVAHQKAGRVTVLLRPDRISPDESGPYQLEGQVVKRVFRGAYCHAVVKINSISLKLVFPSQDSMPAIGQPMKFSFDANEALQFFPGKAERPETVRPRSKDSSKRVFRDHSR